MSKLLSNALVDHNLTNKQLGFDISDSEKEEDSLEEYSNEL